jgi:hypothetical protein
MNAVTAEAKVYDKRHGGPYDRGGADSYYGRSAVPHYFEGGTYQSKEITALTDEETKAYLAGYEDNEEHGDKKEW